MLENILKLDGISILDKKQQQFIMAGGTCGAYVPSGGGNSTKFESGNGGATITESGMTVFMISKSEALSLTKGVSGAKWCCESCSTATWYKT